VDGREVSRRGEDPHGRMDEPLPMVKSELGGARDAGRTIAEAITGRTET
jgi:hypothetical protein